MHRSGELRHCRQTFGYSPSSLAEWVLLGAQVLVQSWYPFDTGIVNRSNPISTAAPRVFPAAAPQAEEEAEARC